MQCSVSILGPRARFETFVGRITREVIDGGGKRRSGTVCTSFLLLVYLVYCVALRSVALCCVALRWGVFIPHLSLLSFVVLEILNSGAGSN